MRGVLLTGGTARGCGAGAGVAAECRCMGSPAAASVPSVRGPAAAGRAGRLRNARWVFHPRACEHRAAKRGANQGAGRCACAAHGFPCGQHPCRWDPLCVPPSTVAALPLVLKLRVRPAGTALIATVCPEKLADIWQSLSRQGLERVMCGVQAL